MKRNNEKTKKSVKMFDNSEMADRLGAIDGITLEGTTRAIIKCVSCCSMVSSVADTVIRDNAGIGHNRDIDEIVHLCAAATDKLLELMREKMEENMYVTDFRQM